LNVKSIETLVNWTSSVVPQLPVTIFSLLFQLSNC
jgi:hypothetical protein